jgi:hypothetical protein
VILINSLLYSKLEIGVLYLESLPKSNLLSKLELTSLLALSLIVISFIY